MRVLLYIFLRVSVVTAIFMAFKTDGHVRRYSFVSLGKNGSPISTQMHSIPHVHFFFPHKAVPQMHVYPTSSSLQSRCTILLTAIRFEFLYPCILFPNTGKIRDKMIWPTLACFVFFSRFLYFSTIAVVPSLSALFVPM